MDAEPVSGVFDGITTGGHEFVVHGHDPASRLTAIIAVHSTRLGPALGGTRFRMYPTEHAALTDALRLSEGMTLKSAAAGLDLGGGKAVIVGDPDRLAGPALWEAYGRLVERLGGAYITAEDVGTTVDHMVEVSRHTRWVTGLPTEMGGSGDPSPHTARGVLAAMRATAEHLWGDPGLRGRRIAIQGVGKVGAVLAELLAGEGAEVLVADVRGVVADDLASDLAAKAIPPHEVLFEEVDILSPCALGAVLSPETIPKLRCKAIVGSANNQLAHESDARRLADAGILYAPDFVVNAGGIINISVEIDDGDYDPDEADRRVDGIADTLLGIFRRAEADGMTPEAAAVAIARERIA